MIISCPKNDKSGKVVYTVVTQWSWGMNFKKTSNLQLTKKREIELQVRYFSKKKVPNQSTLSSIESYTNYSHWKILH
jgi:hypothetical protein